MTMAATTFPRYIRRPGTARRTFTRPGYLKRFRYLIETSDGDEMILLHKGWIDKICLAVIIPSILYFAPILIKVLLR